MKNPTTNETNKRIINITNIINKLSDVFNTITEIILKSLLIKPGKKLVITAISDIISIIDELEKLNDKKLNENTVTVNLKASPNAMEHWATQYINYVEVIKPIELREKIRESLKKAEEKYK